MKITEYPSVTAVASDNILLIDGSAGTKKIATSDLLYGTLHLISPENHRVLFRGKNLGSSLTLEQKAAIQDGSFKDLWLGDYWLINGVKWRIVDFDYWYGLGNPKFVSHHIVVMPDTALYNAKMNESSVTTGGYTGSIMYTTNLETAKTTIAAAFSGAVLTHKDYLINAVTSGYPSGGAFMDSTVDLPNECMIYGNFISTPADPGTGAVKRYTINKTQFSLFRVAPSYILAGDGYWLRDVASATHFARIDAYGAAQITGAANEYGVRPVFAVG